MAYGRYPIKVSAIIPSYNEERQIGTVLSVVREADVLDEILVVDDGSTDRTLEMLPIGNGVRALRLPHNRGKGGAMWAGAESTDADILVFLDADLVGLRPEHLRIMLEPVASGEADMSVGVFRHGRYWTDLAQKLAPYISGQRAIRREMFLSVPEVRAARSGVEVALTHFARVNSWRVTWVTLAGITHVMKEEKMGALRGVRARLGMYREIAHYMCWARCRSRAGSLIRSVRRLLRAEEG
ncbi:MAG: glycosyltransferase family 2 protein [Armatimonadota bacterium]|nr:MAG: glycosyltransferase family 2 protein [Armatimonadota bacterium]